jgi:hypothetical protein
MDQWRTNETSPTKSLGALGTHLVSRITELVKFNYIAVHLGSFQLHRPQEGRMGRSCLEEQCNAVPGGSCWASTPS